MKQLIIVATAKQSREHSRVLVFYGPIKIHIQDRIFFTIK